MRKIEGRREMRVELGKVKRTKCPETAFKGNHSSTCSTEHKRSEVCSGSYARFGNRPARNQESKQRDVARVEEGGRMLDNITADIPEIRNHQWKLSISSENGLGLSYQGFRFQTHIWSLVENPFGRTPSLPPQWSDQCMPCKWITLRSCRWLPSHSLWHFSHIIHPFWRILDVPFWVKIENVFVVRQFHVSHANFSRRQHTIDGNLIKHWSTEIGLASARHSESLATKQSCTLGQPVARLRVENIYMSN